jgi:hypothetical protein
MRILCECCGQHYNIEPARIPPQGKRARCKVCGGVFVLRPPAPGEESHGPELHRSGWKLRLEDYDEDDLTLEEVKQKIRFGELEEHHEVLPAGAANWLPASGVPALQRYFLLRRRASGVASHPPAQPTPPPAPPEPEAAPPPRPSPPSEPEPPVAAEPTGPSPWGEAVTASPADPPPVPDAPAGPAPQAPPVPQSGGVPQAGAATLIVCRNHPHLDADHACPVCRVYYCGECVVIKEVQRVTFNTCPKCHGVLDDVERPRNIKPFWKDLPRILAFPFHRKGVLTFIIYCMIFYASKVAGFAGMLGFAAVVILRGFMAGYILHLIEESGRGKEHPPDFPEFSDIVGDIYIPALRLFVASLLPFGPAIGWLVFAFWVSPVRIPWQAAVLLALLLAAVGLVIYPMVLAILGIWKSFMPSVNPVIIFRLIGRIKTEYAIFLLFWYPLLLFDLILSFIFGMAPLGWLLSGPVHCYVVFVLMHTLGWMCYQCEEKLAWS